ncbi:aldehyde ferredoxin oxidoreductase family protein [Chloroflexota bacterium]
MSRAYKGRILLVDLANRSVTSKDFDEETCRKHIGGAGLAARVVWDETDKDTDPLSPDNPLLFMTGPLTGTVVPSSSRYVVAALSPLSGIWGQAHAGGTWADEFRHTGFDGIIVKGKASSPVYLWIQNGEATIKDAAHLWGKDTYEVNDLLKEGTDAKASVAAIGPAGEKLARTACVMSDGNEARAAARCGMGAVMGSKNLKAVVVRGTDKPEIYDREKLITKVNEYYIPPPKREKGADILQQLDKDTLEELASQAIIPRTPIKNWTLGTFDGFVSSLLEKGMIGEHFYCRRCRSSCIESKMHAGTRCAHWEAFGPLGSQCLVKDMEAVQKAFELCNEYGMDSIETGNAIAFTMELYEKGLISKADTGGVDMEFGSSEALIEMTRMIGEREGFGEVLGEGLRKAAEHVGGIASEYAIHLKGVSFPAHDPRWSNGLALEYATSTTGAWHMSSLISGAFPTYKVPDLGISGIDHSAVQGIAAIVAKMQDFSSLNDSLVCCKFLTASGVTTGRADSDLVQPSHLLEWLNCAAGWDMDLKEFLRCGERNINLQRMINVRRGLSRKDDILPPRFLTHRRGGEPEGNLPPIGPMLADYYAYRGWTEEGIPTEQKLTELGLDGLY